MNEIKINGTQKQTITTLEIAEMLEMKHYKVLEKLDGTKDGKIIAEFDSIMDASKNTGIAFGNISAVCLGTHKTSCGSVWRFKGDDFNKFKVKDDIKTRKVVKQYTLDGEFVKEYPSLSDISKQTDFSFKNISQVCNGKRKSAYGYIWRFAF